MWQDNITQFNSNEQVYESALIRNVYTCTLNKWLTNISSLLIITYAHRSCKLHLHKQSNKLTLYM